MFAKNAAPDKYVYQACSQSLKAVPQNFMKVFKVGDITANDVIQKKQHRLRKEKL